MLVTRVPVRTADLGGWTDTWFAASGLVCNVAIDPGIEVWIEAGTVPDKVALTGSDGATLVGDPAVASEWPDAFLAAFLRDAPRGVHVTIRSGAPAGSGVGTSAALAVAMLAAFDRWSGRQIDALEIARRAHRTETGLGRQSGVQDHAAAALGGVRLWDVDYPSFSPIGEIVDEAVLDALDQRLITVYLGAPHQSSTLHEHVIATLESFGGAENEHRLSPLREAARRGFDALATDDLRAYGMAMVANHEAQRHLHGELVSDLVDHIVTLVAMHGCAGWKVNGAGGEGGSLALLLPEDVAQRASMRRAITSVKGAVVLETSLARSGIRQAEIDDPAVVPAGWTKWPTPTTLAS